jgi:outer membrane protein assembly factor BamB
MRGSKLWTSGSVLGLLIAGLAASGLEAGDWPRFRGPNGAGISPEAVPNEWGPDKNVKWSIDLPGRGVSSPIVVGDKVFVTCYSGYGVEGGSNNVEDLKRHLLCIDRTNGETVWDRTVDAVMPEDEYRPPGTTAHGYASHTPVSDGERVYVFFGKTGVLAFDLEGTQLWQTSVGTESAQQRWGSAASPVVYEDLVIVNASDESEAVVALDKKTGEEKWRKEASMLANTWSTPIVVESKTGPEVVLAVDGETWAFDAQSGKFKWHSKGTTGRSGPNHSVIAGDGIVYSLGGSAVAVRIGGEGEIPDSQLVWQGQAGGRFATPILHNGLLFAVSGNVLSCHDAETGERIYQSRLAGGGDSPAQAERGDRGRQGRGPGGPGGPGGRGGRGGGFGSQDYASPVLAGENLIITMGNGTFYVVKASNSYELVATNKLSDDSGFGATPAVSDGDLFIRSHAKLYCISDD